MPLVGPDGLHYWPTRADAVAFIQTQPERSRRHMRPMASGWAAVNVGAEWLVEWRQPRGSILAATPSGWRSPWG